MSDTFDHPELANLTKGARAKVEAALKSTLDRELALAAAAGGGADPVAAHSRSQGAFFSRSKTTDQVLTGDDRMMVEKMSTMDDAAFEKFSSRLSAIKGIKSR